MVVVVVVEVVAAVMAIAGWQQWQYWCCKRWQRRGVGSGSIAGDGSSGCSDGGTVG